MLRRVTMLGGLVWMGAAPAADVEVGWNARLLDVAGQPVTGPHDVTLRLYAGTTSTVLWARTYPAVPFADGYAALAVGGTGSTGGVLGSSHFAGDVEIGVTLDAGSEMTRQHVLSVPKAAAGGVAGAADLMTLEPRTSNPVVDPARGQLFLRSGSPGNDANTVLLLHFDGAGAAMNDSAAIPNAITVLGDTFQSATTSKFGGKAGFFDGNGDSLSIAENGAFDLGAGDFTVDAWVYPTTLGGDGWHEIISCYSTTLPRWQLIIHSTGYLQTNINDGSADHVCASAAGDVTANQWTHVALVRSGNTLKLYRNGAQVQSCGLTQQVNCSASDIRVGRGHTANGGPHYLFGYLDELRVSKGVARWTAPFTPPTAAYGSGGLFFMSPDGKVTLLAD